MTEPTAPPKPSRFDGNDLLFFAGLALMGTGLAFAISWAIALAVVGGILTAVGLVNAYVLLWLGRG